MDGIRWIEKNVSSIRDDAFDLESSEEYDDSGEELKHVTNEDQCHVEKALTQLPDPVYEAIADGQIEHISKLIKPKKLELQSRMEGFSRIGAQVSSTCDSFDLQSPADSVDSEEDQKQTLAQKSGSPHSVQVHEGMTDIRDLEYLKETFKPKAVELDPEIDCIRRVDPQVSSNSHDTFDLPPYEDSVDLEKKRKPVRKYDNRQRNLMHELLQIDNLRSVDHAYWLLMDFVLSPSFIDRVAAAAITQQELHEITELLSDQQQFRSQEPPKLDSTHLPHLVMSMQTSPSFMETRPQNQSSQMNPDQQPMSLRHELAQVATADVGVVEDLGRTFERRRVELDRVAAAAITQQELHEITELLSHQQQFRTQERPKLESTHLPHLVTSMQTSPSFMETRPQNQSSQMNPDKQPMSLRSELAQVATADVGVVEDLGRTFEHRTVELDPGMDAISQIGTQVNKTRNDTFDALPSVDSIDSEQERNLSLVQHSRSPHPETRYKKLTDIWQMEHLENTLEQKGESLDLSIDGIHRIDTRVSGIPHHIMDQQFDQDSFDSDRELNLGNLEQALTSQVSRNPKLPSFQSVFCLPKYNLPSQTVADAVGALEEAQKQFQLHPRQQSYHQGLRTQEISQTAPTLVMLDLKVSQPLIKNHAQSLSSLMDLLHKLTQTSPEQGSTEMAKEELSQFVENFKKWRELLCVSIKDVTLAIEKLLGQKIKSRLINNFENFNLSTEMMLSFKSVLQLWLQNFVTSFNMRSTNMSMTSTCNTSEFSHLLSTRSKIDPKVRQSLEKFFLEKPYPATKDIAKLAKSFNMEKHTVQTWFRNRRHNESVKKTRTGCSIIFPSSVTTQGSSTMPVSFQHFITDLKVSTTSSIHQQDVN